MLVVTISTTHRGQSKHNIRIVYSSGFYMLENFPTKSNRNFTFSSNEALIFQTKRIFLGWSCWSDIFISLHAHPLPLLKHLSLQHSHELVEKCVLHCIFLQPWRLICKMCQQQTNKKVNLILLNQISLFFFCLKNSINNWPTYFIRHKSYKIWTFMGHLSIKWFLYLSLIWWKTLKTFIYGRQIYFFFLVMEDPN